MSIFSKKTPSHLENPLKPLSDQLLSSPTGAAEAQARAVNQHMSPVGPQCSM